MNTAYLLLVHNQPSQLVRLIDRLNQPQAYFFIHIDSKSPDKNAILTSLGGYSNVKAISVYDVNWMGFNMVKSTIDLLELAFASGIGFKYYVLMSGQDYPIKGNSYISNFFETHNTDFISFAKIADSPDNYKNKVRYFHYYDFPYTNPRNRKKIPFMVYLYYGIHKRFRKFMPRRRFYNGMEPYFGSQWFALTHNTVKYVLDFIKDNKGYLDFMKYTEGPDETFFHTIVLNSPRRTNVHGYEKFEQWNKVKKPGEYFVQEYSSLRYMDWSDRGRNVPKPAVLDSSYYDVLRNSSDLFARKVDEKISAALMDRIDNELLHGK